MCHISAVASPSEGDHIVRAGLDAYTATGTEFSLEIQADSDSILHFIDLLFRDRVERKQLERIDRACDNTVVAPGAPF